MVSYRVSGELTFKDTVPWTIYLHLLIHLAVFFKYLYQDAYVLIKATFLRHIANVKEFLKNPKNTIKVKK